MLNSGTDWKELQMRLEHKSIAATMDIYTELDPNLKSETVDIFLDKSTKLEAKKDREILTHYLFKGVRCFWLLLYWFFYLINCPNNMQKS